MPNDNNNKQNTSAPQPEINSEGLNPNDNSTINNDSVNNQQPSQTQPPQPNIMAPSPTFLTPNNLPENNTPDNTPSQETEKPVKKSKKGLIFILLFILILIGGLSFSAYALAYEKIKLEKYPDFQYAVSNFVMSLPFTPKTPKFLLGKAFEAENNVESSRFDLSASVKNSQISDVMGLNQIDILLKGEIDKKSETDYDVSFNFSVGKEFSSDVIKYGKTSYFKINTIPVNLLNLMGFNTDSLNPLLNQWISYDLERLNTNSAKELQQKQAEEYKFTDEYIKEKLEELLDEKISEKIIVSSIEEDGKDVYELYLSADSELINHIQTKMEAESLSNKSAYVVSNNYSSEQKLSDYVKNLVIKIHISKNTYYIKKVAIVFDIIADEKISSAIENSSVLGLDTSVYSFLESKISIALVAEFDGHGKDVQILPPQNSITSEEATKKFQEEILPQLYPALQQTDDSYANLKINQEETELQP